MYVQQAQSLQRHLYKTRTKVKNKIKPPAELKRLGPQCKKALGGRPPPPSDHVVSSALYLSPWLKYINRGYHQYMQLILGRR